MFVPRWGVVLLKRLGLLENRGRGEARQRIAVTVNMPLAGKILCVNCQERPNDGEIQPKGFG